MTEPDLFAAPGCRHHVADLDLAIGDDHPIDQEFHQSPFLLECGIRQPLPHSFAEGVGASIIQESNDINMLMGISFHENPNDIKDLHYSCTNAVYLA
jgi:hypothetical protein